MMNAVTSSPSLPRDVFDRPMRDLRVSVTDRCNFRCPFCMPADRQYTFMPRPEILTFEEITRVVRLFVDLGVRKVRLTGGEPLLRAQIETLVAQLRAIDGLEDLALTTNAYLLPKHAAALKEAGLDRVTVSLHSLEPETFARMNGLGYPLSKVLDGIEAAVQAGLAPVKLNTVVICGTNEHEIVDIARYAREIGAVVRYIEYMDVGTVNSWDAANVFSARQIVDAIDAVFPVEPVAKDHRGEVADRYRYVDGGGEIGVITSVTQPFCGDCTRVRLSAEGRIYTCLFAAMGHDLKKAIREGKSDEEIQDGIRQIWGSRTDRYSEERTTALKAGEFVAADKVEMFRIGG